jgi:hypothetical protein
MLPRFARFFRLRDRASAPAGQEIDGSGLDKKNFSPKTITLNLTAHAWSIKYKRNKNLIAQFTCKLRDERFEPN